MKEGLIIVLVLLALAVLYVYYGNGSALSSNDAGLSSSPATNNAGTAVSGQNSNIITSLISIPRLQLGNLTPSSKVLSGLSGTLSSLLSSGSAQAYTVFDIAKISTAWNHAAHPDGTTVPPYISIEQIVPAVAANGLTGVPAIPQHNEELEWLVYNAAKLPQFVSFLIGYKDYVLKHLQPDGGFAGYVDPLPPMITDGTLTLLVTPQQIVSLVPGSNGLTFNAPGSFSMTDKSGSVVASGGWHAIGSQHSYGFTYQLWLTSSKVPLMDLSKLPELTTQAWFNNWQTQQDSAKPVSSGTAVASTTGAKQITFKGVS